MASLAYLNGRFIPENELRLSFADAGFVFGATVTDFCRTYHHKLFRWPDHLARLRRDAATCHIPLLPTDAVLTTAAEQLVAARSLDLEPGDDLALITFATPGPLGYMAGAKENGPPTLGMHCFPIQKARYRKFFSEGVELEFVGRHGSIDDIVPITAKHRSRLAWWMAGHMVVPGRIAVVTDLDHLSFDTAIGSVAAVMTGGICIPPTEQVLDSVSGKVLRELCGELSIDVEEKSPLSLVGVKEWLLAGSAFGIVGVKGIHGTGLPMEYSWPGPVTRKLQAAWSRLVGVDIVEQMMQ